MQFSKVSLNCLNFEVTVFLPPLTSSGAGSFSICCLPSNTDFFLELCSPPALIEAETEPHQTQHVCHPVIQACVWPETRWRLRNKHCQWVFELKVEDNWGCGIVGLITVYIMKLLLQHLCFCCSSLLLRSLPRWYSFCCSNLLSSFCVSSLTFLLGLYILFPFSSIQAFPLCLKPAHMLSPSVIALLSCLFFLLIFIPSCW